MLREFVPEPAYSTTDDDTVYALLSRRAQKNPDDLIAQWQDDETRQWHDVTAGQMLARVRAVAKGLIGLGVKAGVSFLSDCRRFIVRPFQHNCNPTQLRIYPALSRDHRILHHILSARSSGQIQDS